MCIWQPVQWSCLLLLHCLRLSFCDLPPPLLLLWRHQVGWPEQQQQVTSATVHTHSSGHARTKPVILLSKFDIGGGDCWQVKEHLCGLCSNVQELHKHVGKRWKKGRHCNSIGRQRRGNRTTLPCEWRPLEPEKYVREISHVRGPQCKWGVTIVTWENVN